MHMLRTDKKPALIKQHKLCRAGSRTRLLRMYIQHTWYEELKKNTKYRKWSKDMQLPHAYRQLTTESEAKTYNCPELFDTPAKPLIPAEKKHTTNVSTIN